MSLIFHFASRDLLPILQVQALEKRGWWFHIGYRSEKESRYEEDKRKTAPIRGSWARAAVQRRDPVHFVSPLEPSRLGKET